MTLLVILNRGSALDSSKLVIDMLLCGRTLIQLIEAHDLCSRKVDRSSLYFEGMFFRILSSPCL